MKSALINTSLLCALVTTMAYIGPQLEDDGPANEVAAEELAKQHRQDRFEKAAQEVCGQNSSYRLTHKQGEIICLTKRNHATGKVAQL